MFSQKSAMVDIGKDACSTLQQRRCEFPRLCKRNCRETAEKLRVSTPRKKEVASCHSIDAVEACVFPRHNEEVSIAAIIRFHKKQLLYSNIQVCSGRFDVFANEQSNNDIQRRLEPRVISQRRVFPRVISPHDGHYWLCWP